MQEFFALNRPVVLFVYGQTFFVMGLAIFLQSRRHSRLRLARDLTWLAMFGLLHGLHEWGDIFVPIQSTYLPPIYIELLNTLQVLLLALSFVCLFYFGVVTMRWKHGLYLVGIVTLLWLAVFWSTFYITPSLHAWHRLSSNFARYMLGFPGSLIAAFGLRFQAHSTVVPLGDERVFRALRLVEFALVAYAILGGLIASPIDFFPANVLNRATFETHIGIPIEVFRSITGLTLAISMIRALSLFEIEVDHMIEGMQVQRIQAEERERIGQEIHDGAIQSVYSASLILASMEQYIQDNVAVSTRLDRAERVLKGAITDLRSYMVSLRADAPTESLAESLNSLTNDPRYTALLQVKLNMLVQPELTPLQVGHVLGIVQECFSNTIRHADARVIQITLDRCNEGILLQIKDDGQGFDGDKINLGYGLRTMKDRARLLGSTLQINSSSGKGTIVSITIPQE